MSMGHWSEFKDAEAFDGGVCKVCYYDQYNTVLKQLTQEYKHEEFI